MSRLCPFKQKYDIRKTTYKIIIKILIPNYFKRLIQMETGKKRRRNSPTLFNMLSPTGANQYSKEVISPRILTYNLIGSTEMLT